MPSNTAAVPPGKRVSISIVSHRHGALVHDLLQDIGRFCGDVEVLLTINVPEQALDEKGFNFPLHVARNAAPKGFGANHNAAFARAAGKYFCVLNPDIRLPADPFPTLIAALAETGVGVAAPRIVNPEGETEDSARRFPTLWTIVRKVFTGAPHHDYEVASVPLRPDWVAGMFMLFRSDVFRRLGGFDERYFLYYEDVDLCLRLRRLGHAAVLDPRAVALHDARRASHHDLRHLLWHARSLARFLASSRRGRNSRLESGS
jgi:GT2 family glycosyltransferase